MKPRVLVEEPQDPGSTYVGYWWWVYSDVTHGVYEEMAYIEGDDPGCYTFTCPSLSFSTGGWWGGGLHVELWATDNREHTPGWGGTQGLVSFPVWVPPYEPPTNCPVDPTEPPEERCPGDGSSISIEEGCSPPWTAPAITVRLPVEGTPKSIAPCFRYFPESDMWVFSALPGDMSTSENGTTNESTPRTAHVATVLGADGTTRKYCSDSSDGPFVPIGGFHTALEKTDDGHVESIGKSVVRYDANGRIEAVIRAGVTQTYTYDGDTVSIEANTVPRTKLECGLTDDKVSTVSFLKSTLSGWTTVSHVSVSWDGDHMTELSRAPDGSTNTFSYYPDGPLASFEDCAGRLWSLRYSERS